MRRYLSWIEGLTTNQNVTGSNPVRRTTRDDKGRQSSRLTTLFGLSRDNDCTQLARLMQFLPILLQWRNAESPIRSLFPRVSGVITQRQTSHQQDFLQHHGIGSPKAAEFIIRSQPFPNSRQARMDIPARPTDPHQNPASDALGTKACRSPIISRRRDSGRIIKSRALPHGALQRI